MMNETMGYRLDLERRNELLVGATDCRAVAAMTFSAPEEIDPRRWHRIEMQGSMGSCQGHALSSVCELAFHVATGEATQFSPLFAYYATQSIDGLLGRDCGSTIAGGLKCAREFGQCPIDVMPYPDPVEYTGEIPEQAWEAASPFRIRSHAFCHTYDDVFNFLASGQGGVEIGIAWGNGMTPRNGVINTFSPGSGGHAVALLGYSKRTDSSGRKFIWMANSWSIEWGNQGWAEVAPSAIDAMCRHADTVMIGMSDLAVPKPRRIDWMKESVFT